MTRITISMLKQKIELASEILNEKMENQSYNGYEHLKLRGENIFAGIKRECYNFINGLINFKLLTA